MAISAILPLIKTAASNFGKSALKNKAKDFISGKKKKKKTAKIDDKKQSAIVKPLATVMSGDGGVLSTPSVPLTPKSSSSNSKVDTGKKISFDKLTESVNNIVKITSDIRDTQRREAELDKKLAEKERLKKLKDARSRREALLEKGQKIGAAVVTKATEKFDILKFLEAILLGGGLLAAKNLLSGQQKIIDNLSGNIFRLYKIIPKILKLIIDPFGIFGKLFKGFSEGLQSLYKNTAGKLFSKGKELIEKGLRKLGTAVKEFIEGISNRLKKAAQEGLEQLAKNADEAAKFIKETIENAIKRSDEFIKAAKKQAAKMLKEAGEQLAERGIKPAVKAAQQFLDPAVDAVKKGGKAAFNRLPGGLQSRLTNVGQGASNIVRSGVGLARSGFNALADVSKNIGKALYELPGNAIKGARAAGENLAKQAANLKDKGEKALIEFAEKNLKPVMTKLLDENPLIKSAKKFFTKPKTTIESTVKTVTKEATGVLGILKNARKSGLTELGPLDRVIAVVESVVRYGLGEAPVNAVLQTLGGVLGYAAGFAVGAPAGGVPGLLTGLVGSELGERAAKLLIKSLLPLGKNEDGSPRPDPIAQTLGLPERPLIRDPYMEFEDYRNQFGIEGGKFFNADIPNLFGDKEESPKYFESGGRYYAMDTSQRFLGDTEEEAKATLGIKPEQDQEEVTSEAQIDRNVSPAISETTSKVEQSASYEESEEEVIVTIPASQQQQSQPMIRSKSRVVMVGGDSNDRYYKAQLIGALYKRG